MINKFYPPLIAVGGKTYLYSGLHISILISIIKKSMKEGVSMDIKHIENFIVIAQEQNITRAALRLHMSQPALTRQLQLLEEQVGVPLFIRGKRQMDLTDAGIYFKKHAGNILEQFMKLEQDLNGMKNNLSGSITIAMLEAPGAVLFAEWMEDFTKKYPEIHYSLKNGTPDEIMDEVDKGLVDIGITRNPLPESKYETIYLEKDPWIVVMNTESELAKKTDHEVTLEQLSFENLIVPGRIGRDKEMIEWFREVGINPKIVGIYGGSLFSAIELLRRNLGVVIAPRSVEKLIHDPQILCKEIQGLTASTRGVIIWNKYKKLSNVVNAFVEYCNNKNNA